MACSLVGRETEYLKKGRHSTACHVLRFRLAHPELTYSLSTGNSTSTIGYIHVSLYSA